MSRRRSDTQWPRFEVFQQTREDAPFANVGAVHAPDAEMALQNARDVFVRRPETHRLWVVPASAILMRTAQELAQVPRSPAEDLAQDEPPRRFYVFRKTSQRRSMSYVTQAGEVTAHTPLQALHAARDRFDDGEEAYVWWIVPADRVVASDDEDAESMFAPARDKDYRMPTAYHTRTLMRRVKEGRGEQ